MYGQLWMLIIFCIFNILQVGCVLNELRCEKTGLRGFRPGLTQTGLYNHRRWHEISN